MRLFVGLLRLLRFAAMLGLLAMMLVTIVDVTMRLTMNRLLLGSVELVELALVAAVFLALPETVLDRRHIAVDVVDRWLPPRGVRLLEQAAAVATAGLLAVMAWRMIGPALDTLEIGDRTSDLGISHFWYWLPIVVGSVTAAAAAVLALARPVRPPAGEGG
jgi:TRAP-type transport system small permease protein